MVGKKLLRTARFCGDVSRGDGFVADRLGHRRGFQRINLPQRPDIFRIYAPRTSDPNMKGLKAELCPIANSSIQNPPNTLMA